METDFNKNQSQLNFNSIKGVIKEIVNDGDYSAVILEAGHETKRSIYLSIPTKKLNDLSKHAAIGNKVEAKFYIASKLRNGRWFTNVNILDIKVCEN
jgi:hypothetical protein